MVERIVLFKFQQSHANPASRGEVATRARELLSAIPSVGALSVGIPADPPSEKSWDLSLVLRFETLEDVEAFRAHPAHREFVDVFLGSRLEVIKAWNFEVV